jgi:hypothetical protein
MTGRAGDAGACQALRTLLVTLPFGWSIHPRFEGADTIGHRGLRRRSKIRVARDYRERLNTASPAVGGGPVDVARGTVGASLSVTSEQSRDLGQGSLWDFRWSAGPLARIFTGPSRHPPLPCAAAAVRKSGSGTLVV